MSNGFSLNLVESELKIVLESLIEREARLLNICSTSEDEDEVAEVGNDLTELRLLLAPLKEKAVAEFGESILNFDDELL